MIAGSSIFLFLLPLAAAPVIFHLLMRRRRRRILFSTKMFFDRVHPQLTMHRKLRELLLLAARVSLILLLLLALSRLVMTGFGNALGLGGKQVVAIILDNSASMAGKVKGSERTKLSTAVAGARALLMNMDEDAKAGLVPLVPDPRAGDWGGTTADSKLLLDFLEKARVTQATGEPAKAMARAIAMLAEASSSGGGSIHVFTDLQESEWKAQRIDAKNVGENVHVFFHRIPTAPPERPNVCLTEARISSRRILPRQPYQVELLLRNDGDSEVEVRVNKQDQDDLTTDTRKVVLGAGARERVMMGFRAQEPGAHWIRVWIEGDGFAGDNRASLAYICEPTGDIYFVGGRQASDFGVLPLAFSPYGDGRYTSLVPRFCAPGELRDRIAEKTPLLVVLKWSDLLALNADTAGTVEQYVRQGGNLLVLPAVAGTGHGGRPPAWLGAGVEDLTVLPEAAPLRVLEGASEFWSDLRAPDGKVRFDGGHVNRYHSLSLNNDAGYEPLLDAGDGRVVLAVRGLDEGQITVSGMAFAGRQAGIREWGTLPMKKVFLVMVQPIALGAVSSPARRNISVVAGKAPRALPGTEEQVSITTLVGDPVDWSGPRDQAPVLVREGAYVARTGRRETCLSVMPSEAEGAAAFVADAEVAAMGEIPHAVGDLSDEEDFRDELENSAAGMDLYAPLLLLAVAALIVEGMLGSPSPRRIRGPAGENKQEFHARLTRPPVPAAHGEVTS